MLSKELSKFNILPPKESKTKTKAIYKGCGEMCSIPIYLGREEHF